MPAYKFANDFAGALHEIEVHAQCLREGHAPPGQVLLGRHEKTSIRAAADILKDEYQTLIRRIGTPGRAGASYRYFKARSHPEADKLLVDWTQFRVPEGSTTIIVKEPAPEPPPVPEAAPADPVELRRLKDTNAALSAANKDLERRVIASENWRGDVLGLRDLPPAPIGFGSREQGQSSAETIVLVLSDLHWGERVDIGAMDGLNSYSVEIARNRLGRWTHAVCDLATKHWSGPPADRIVLILGGDLISGGIHLELAKSDEMKPFPAVRDCADHLRQAILTIKESVSCPIDVISLPGNHGRSTLKPESKEASATSHDILVSDFLELGLSGHKDITFYAPPSPDALFSVYGWRVLATHGDKIGSRGGTGFVGVAATAARGMKRIISDYSARGIHLDLILLGHFHTRLLLEEGFVNGSLVGPSEYSRDSRFRPMPASQLFLSIHPRRVVTQMRPIEVGHPSEGALYEPPPVDRALRPRYRVPAVTQPV